MYCARGNGTGRFEDGRVNSFFFFFFGILTTDGTCIGFNIFIVWLAYSEGYTLSTPQFIVVTLVSMLGSMGASPIPNAGSIMLLALAEASGVHVPAKSLMFALLLAVFPILDRLETCVNVTGDCIAVGIIAGLHGEDWEKNNLAIAAENEAAAVKAAAVKGKNGSTNSSRVDRLALIQSKTDVLNPLEENKTDFADI